MDSAASRSTSQIVNSDPIPHTSERPQSSFFDKVHGFVGEKPQCSVDPIQPQSHMSAPSRQSRLNTAKQDTLKTVLKAWVSQGKGADRANRVKVAKKIQQSDATLKNGKIVVKGTLDIGGCTALTSLPENLRVGCNLNLNGCTALTSLPEKLSVGGGLDLGGCTALTSLPEKLDVESYLYLGGCTALTSLPENLGVDSYINLVGCTALASVGKNLSVVDFLGLSGCTALTSLPKKLSVGDSLYLRGCSALKSLPEKLSLGDVLDLVGCTALTRLPENLSVGGLLNLSGCTALTSLPEKISCRALKMSEGRLNQVPLNLEKVTNIEIINLFDNQIQALPDRLGQLPAGTQIIVEGNPMPREEIRRFRAAHPHITLRADDFDIADHSVFSVHERKMVQHFETLYQTLVQVNASKNALQNSQDTRTSLLSAAKQYKMPMAKRAIDYMLNEQGNVSVIDFNHVTSSQVLTSAWALIQSQAKKEDRDNGTENLIKHLANAKGYCSTRHTEEVLLALQDSYGVTLKTTAAQARSDTHESDAPKVALTVGDAVGYFMQDMKNFAKQIIEKTSDISNDQLQGTFNAGLYRELEQKHSHVESLEKTVSEVVRYLGEDWDVFVAMVKEMPKK